MKIIKPFKFNKLMLGVAVLTIALGGLFIISGREKAPDFQTAEVARGDIEVAISAAGKIQPKNYVDVGAQVSGQLEEFFFEVGDRVEKGDLLAQIDETLAATKVEADRAQLKELDASFAQQQASLELSNANAARADMLYKADAISQAEYQAAIADRKIAAARLVQLEAQIERQNSTLQADEATLEFTKIYAPMSGTIVSQAAVVGQTLNANQTTPTILRIADLTVMTIEAEVSEADVLRVKKGQAAYFTTLGGGGGKWSTEVRQVLPQPEILNDVVLYKVLLDIANDDELLKPEMTAQVFFVSGSAKDAVLAPVAALRDARRPRESGRKTSGDSDRQPGLMSAQAKETPRETGQQNPRRAALREVQAANPDAERKMAMVIINGEPRPQPVLVGLQNRTQAEILFGLEPGDVVITGQTFAAPSATGRDRTRRPPGMGRRGLR